MVYNNRLFKKHVLVKPQILQRFSAYDPDTIRDARSHNCFFESVPDLNLAEAVKYLQKEHKYKQILVECGPSITRDYYMRDLDLEVEQPSCDMPMDTLLLTIYNGEISPDCVGPVFPSLDQIGLRYNMVMHTEPVEADKGQWSITCWRVRSRAELLKLKNYEEYE